MLNLIHLRHSTYNLVKCELVDLIASLDFKVINYIENILPSDEVLNNLKKKHAKNKESHKKTEIDNFEDYEDDTSSINDHSDDEFKTKLDKNLSKFIKNHLQSQYGTQLFYSKFTLNYFFNLILP